MTRGSPITRESRGSLMSRIARLTTMSLTVPSMDMAPFVPRAHPCVNAGGAPCSPCVRRIRTPPELALGLCDRHVPVRLGDRAGVGAQAMAARECASLDDV